MSRKKRKPLGNPDSVNLDDVYRMAGIPLEVPSAVNVVNNESGEQEKIPIWEKEGVEAGGKQDVLGNFHPSAVNVALDNQKQLKQILGIISAKDFEFMVDYNDRKYDRNDRESMPSPTERQRFSRLMRKIQKRVTHS